MTLKTTKRQLKMYELNFVDYLDPQHELLRAADLIEWDQLHHQMSTHYSTLGRRGKPIRLMVGLHLLKHRYDCGDERAVEELHENAYWQCFCGFPYFQRGKIVDSTSLVKFRNRIGIAGMQQIESVLMQGWHSKGLVKTRRAIVDTTAQPKNIAYPTDADLLHNIREKIVKKVKTIKKHVGFNRSFRSFTRVSKKILLNVKKLYRNKPEKRIQSIKDLLSMTHQVVRQGSRISNSLYARGYKVMGRQLNRLLSVGRKIVEQTRKVMKDEKPKKRLYSLHEHSVAVIKKGKAHKECEFGSLVSLMTNDDGVILSHAEYQINIADPKTTGKVINRMRANTGQRPDTLGGDRGFDQSYKKQERCRRRWGVKKIAIPKKGKKPHRNSEKTWFKQTLKQRAKIEPVIGHLKTDHRMGRCRYKGPEGDTTNVVWAVAAWNMKKTTKLYAKKQAKTTRMRMKQAV
jgi:IS5 family transposase